MGPALSQNRQKWLLLMSARPHATTLLQLGLIFVKFEVFFKKSVGEIQVSLKSDKNNGYFIWRPIYKETQTKRELLKNPTKIEEIQKQKFIDKLNHYNVPFKTE